MGSWRGTALLCAACMVGALPANAVEKKREVVVYPFAGDLSPAWLQDAEAQVRAALAAPRARPILEASSRKPRTSCGSAASASVRCLARQAKGGFVLRGVLKRGEASSILALILVDADRRVVGPVRAALDVMLPDPQILARAIEELEAPLRASEPPPPAKEKVAAPVVAALEESAPEQAAPEPPHPAEAPAAEVAAADAAPAAAEAPAGEAAPIASAAPTAPAALPAPLTPPLAAERTASAPPAGPVQLAAAAPAPRREGEWLAPAALWTAAGGGAALAAGGIVGLLGRKKSNDLQQKYSNNLLTPADRSSYSTVKAEAGVANALFIAGGAALATAGVFWVLIPEGPARVGSGVGLSGKF